MVCISLFCIENFDTTSSNFSLWKGSFAQNRNKHTSAIVFLLLLMSHFHLCAILIYILYICFSHVGIRSVLEMAKKNHIFHYFIPFCFVFFNFIFIFSVSNQILRDQAVGRFNEFLMINAWCCSWWLEIILERINSISNDDSPVFSISIMTQHVAREQRYNNSILYLAYHGDSWILKCYWDNKTGNKNEKVIFSSVSTGTYFI